LVNAGTLRKVVFDWIAAGGAPSSTVYTTYGPIEEWDVSDVTNMEYIFRGATPQQNTFGSFNADLSKWDTSRVENMKFSKCTCTPLGVFSFKQE
jgi:surface protein